MVKYEQSSLEENVKRSANKDQIRNLGRYLDIVKCKLFSTTKEL